MPHLAKVPPEQRLNIGRWPFLTPDENTHKAAPGAGAGVSLQQQSVWCPCGSSTTTCWAGDGRKHMSCDSPAPSEIKKGVLSTGKH